jgi:hypothetical protein
VPKPQASVRDYVREGQSRLKEQIGEFATQASEQASNIAAQAGAKLAETSSDLLATAKQKSGELLEETKETVTRFTHDAQDQMAAGATAVKTQVKARVDTLIAKAGGVQSDYPETGRSATVEATASRRFDETVSAAKAALPDAQTRDRMLLGVAGLAVAAALGVACQRRMAEKA